MHTELSEIKEYIKSLEKMQDKIDKRIKDTAAYREINAQLMSVVKVSIVSIVIIVVVFCTALMYTFTKSQRDLYDFFANETTETVTQDEYMEADNNGIILNGSYNNNLNTD